MGGSTHRAGDNHRPNKEPTPHPARVPTASLSPLGRSGCGSAQRQRVGLPVPHLNSVVELTLWFKFLGEYRPDRCPAWESPRGGRVQFI